MSARRTDQFHRGGRRKSVFKGIAVVPGIAMGQVHLKFRQSHAFSDYTLSEGEVSGELERLQEAVRLSKEQLMVSRGKVAQKIGEVEATIFDTHIALLEDRSFLGKIRNEIERDLKPAEVVVSEIVEGYYQALSMVADANIRERAADIRDVGRRLLDNLSEMKTEGKEVQVEDHTGDIVFARELLPSDIATIEHHHVAGVVSATGNDRGHCAVMLRALGLPSVMGVEGLTEILRDGDFVIVDGGSGVVLVNPRDEVIEEYQGISQQDADFRATLMRESEEPCVTQDGHAVSLLINISQAEELNRASGDVADGVGLYRTEFELMDHDSFPDEEHLFRVYRGVVESCGDRPLTMRTMDIGSEKKLGYLKMPDEENHALGLRSIRLAGRIEEYMLVQLRAILRAAKDANVRIMFPFITTVEDIRQAKRLLRQAVRQLKARKASFKADVEVGMMVEVPAVALSLDRFAREVQFFSVGTNDLTQYVCAADRNQREVANWYKGHNPGMLSLLKAIVDASRAHDRPLTICGEMAGDPFYTLFLIGIGVESLSMSAPQIPVVKRLVRSVDLAGARNVAERAMRMSTTTQVRNLFADTVERILGPHSRIVYTQNN